MKTLISLTIAGALFASTASAQNVDTFDNGANPNGWWWNGFVPIMEPVGGNPGWWYRDNFINDFIPALRTGSATGLWAGDYRANGVHTIAFDAQTITGPSATQPMTIVLKDTKGTPSDPNDDDYAFYVDSSVVMPQAGAGWSHYEFDIPSQSTTLPAGWAAASGGWFTPGFTAGYTWDMLIQNVDQVEIWMNDPTAFGMWLVWDCGVDSIVINNAPLTPELVYTGLVGGGTTTLTVSNATAGGNVIVGYSLAGAGPTNTPYGMVDMSNPITVLPTLTADAGGVASFSSAIPTRGTGFTLYSQGVDLGSGDLTNSVAEVIL